MDMTSVNNITDLALVDKIIEDDEYISNPVTKNSISTVRNLKTANNLSNASTNGCISLKSSKLSQKRKRCSFVSSNISILKDQKYKT